MSEPVRSRVETGAADDRILIDREHDGNRTAWQDLIDGKLIEWGRNPDALEDDGIRPPSATIIKLACQVATILRDEEWPPPLRVIPNGDGGIVFERREGQLFVTIEIDEDGSIEYAAFVNCRLVSQHRLQ